jgi:VanZ family protein
MSNKVDSRFFRYWLPVVLYCVLIFIQSSFPAPQPIPRFMWSDKLLHLTAYAVLGMLLLRAFRNSRYRDHRFIVHASIFLAAFYGTTDELHQYFVPSRQADLTDLLFDCLGAWVGVWAYHKLVVRYPVLGKI